MNLSKEEKEENRGSVEFQVFSFTNKIRRLASHLELHKKDFSSERGLRRLLGKRRRLQNYYEATRLEIDPYDRSYILYNIGLIHTSNGEHTKALEYYFRALERAIRWSDL